MKSKGLSSSRLAEILEIQPSGISHLVSGRNKPGFDLLQRILRSFPDVNPYWLMLDDGEMYRRQTPEPRQVAAEPRHAYTVPSTADASAPLPPPMPASSVAQVAEVDVLPSPDLAASDLPSRAESLGSKIDLLKPRLKRVVLLYDDDTCETYTVK
ncbi:MAG: helix-turn-helix transcriptional regulator [Rikenellaceae bacterium]